MRIHYRTEDGLYEAWVIDGPEDLLPPTSLAFQPPDAQSTISLLYVADDPEP